MNPDDIIAKLNLKPHPEGGWYGETFRDAASTNGRANATAIYFLLKRGERSHWHRVDATEIWLWHAGAPLKLSLAKDGAREEITLGADLAANQQPQGIVPTNWWQAAESLGDWTLVSCVVAPGFDFAGFELAPTDWSPSSVV